MTAAIACICFLPFFVSVLVVFALWAIDQARQAARRELEGPLFDPDKTWPGDS